MHPTRQVLRIANVRRFVTARFFAGLARSLLRATIHWHLWKVTGSAFYLGLMGLVEFLPVIPASLLAGAVADSRDRRRVMIAAQSVTWLCASALCFGSYSGTAELPVEIDSCGSFVPVWFTRQAIQASCFSISPLEFSRARWLLR